MPTSLVRSVIEHLRRAVTPESDGELLGRFVERRDERALAALVDRHGPMVWGVCRRVLSHHDAEDAFQAAFIVLVRKAASVKPREMVGNWLYGVAQHAALQARRTIARRREVQVTEMPDAAAAQNDQWPDVQPLLDQELSRLPDRYRAVLVLCDLEGKTRRDVAVQLGCPEGTVASRLVRARSMLAKRLTQRGVVLSGGSLAAVLSHNIASAAVPAAVVSSTIKAASLCGQVSLKVAALTEGVLKTMLLTKLKSVMAVLVIVAMIGAIGFGIARGQQKGDTPQAAEKAEVPVVKEKAEMDDATAWGKEVDGLQAGLLAEAATCRLGEQLKFTLKLRNVGKAEATVTYSLSGYSPSVTTDSGGRVTVYMPPPYSGYSPPIKRTLKPGETITLYNPKVAVEPEGRAKLLIVKPYETSTICVAPGKYKIAYGDMLQSHPKVATGTAEFEVKDQVAWGKEANGLQAGLYISNASDVRIGGKVQMVVKLRNVSKETIKVSAWPLWMNYPGVVDARGDRVRTTRAPIPLFEIIPQALTLKPGETVDVGRSDLLVAEPDQKVTVPDGVVDLCAIHVKPGMYKAGCIGFIQEHPTLATGTVEFEVKPAESVTAWGEEQPGGIQIGLGYLSGEKRVYSTGESVTLVVRARSVGRQDVQLEYVRDLWINYPPTIIDGDGKKYPMPKVITNIIQESSQETLKAGKETDLYRMKLELRPAGEADDKQVMKIFGTGKFQIHEEFGLIGRAWVGENRNAATDRTLPSGKLEIEVKEPGKVKQEKEKDAVTAWGKEVGGLQAGLSIAEKRAYSHGETVTLVVRVRNVGKEAVKFRYLKEFFMEKPPTVTGGESKAVRLGGVDLFGRLVHIPVDVNLAPGKEMELHDLKLKLEPASEDSDVTEVSTEALHGKGKFQILYEQLAAASIDPNLTKLATGKLELEVKEAEKPEK